ncbi:hypothetical protein EAE25_24095 [Salmonella enterica]|nr:hypothetical protein [Salmonella enterica]
MIAKAVTIKSRIGKSGRCVTKAVGLTPGDLYGVLNSGLNPSQEGLIAIQKSAEGIVGET